MTLNQLFAYAKEKNIDFDKDVCVKYRATDTFNMLDSLVGVGTADPTGPFRGQLVLISSEQYMEDEREPDNELHIKNMTYYGRRKSN